MSEVCISCEAAAQQYAARNWPIIFLNGKIPFIKDWTQVASTDPAVIHEWFHEHTRSNVGILTGVRSNLVVIDVDGMDGAASLSSLEATNGPLPRTLTCKTGRGKHLYYQHPKVRVRNSSGGIAKGIDVRGDGGMVVAPPSLHSTGVRYAWLDETAEVAVAPDWLISLVTSEDVHAPEDEGTIPEGKRNDTLHKHAIDLLYAGMQAHDATVALICFNRLKCVPPLPDEEVKALVESAARFVQTHPKKNQSKRRCPLFWLPFYAVDFLSSPDIGVLADYQTGWYLRLLSSAWLRGGVLPDDFESLYRLARADSRKKFRAEMDKVLFEFSPVEVSGKQVLENHSMAGEWGQALLKWTQTKEARGARDEKKQAEQNKIEKAAA